MLLIPALQAISLVSERFLRTNLFYYLSLSYIAPFSVDNDRLPRVFTNSHWPDDYRIGNEKFTPRLRSLAPFFQSPSFPISFWRRSHFCVRRGPTTAEQGSPYDSFLIPPPFASSIFLCGGPLPRAKWAVNSSGSAPLPFDQGLVSLRGMFCHNATSLPAARLNTFF